MPTIFQISRGTVSAHLRAAGITLRLSPLTPEEADRAVRLYIGGLSTAQVAERLGRSASLICLTLMTTLI